MSDLVQEISSVKNIQNGTLVLKKWVSEKKGRIYALINYLNITPSAYYHNVSGVNGPMKELTWKRFVKAVVYLSIQEALDENFVKPVYYCDREPAAGQFRKMEFTSYFMKNTSHAATFNRLVKTDNLVQDIIEGQMKYNHFLHDAFLSFREGKNETFHTYIDSYFKKNKDKKLEYCYQLYNEMFPDYKHKTGYHMFWRYCFERKNIRNKRTMINIRSIIEESRKKFQ